MMESYFDQLVTGIENVLENQPEKWSANKVRALEIARLGRRLYSGESKVAYCGVYAPFDILNAMGVTSCFVEFFGAMLASMDAAEPALSLAEQAGYASDTCGYHRAVNGAAIQGLMPIPDFLVATSSPCAGGLAVIENLARHFERDLFVLHLPNDPNEQNVRYLADQLEDMISFIADHTGEPADRGKMREAFERTNAATEAMDRLFRLAAHEPSPINGKDLANFGLTNSLLFGREAAVRVAEAFVKQCESRIEHEQAGVAGEKLRILWIQNRIQFANLLIPMMEGDHRAAIVCDEFNWIDNDPIDLGNPLISIARRMIGHPLNCNIEHRLRVINELAVFYRVDGAVNPCNWGCRQGTASRGMIQDSLSELGVPTLNLEVDCVDRRNFSEGQMKTRMEAFLEMLSGRVSPWD